MKRLIFASLLLGCIVALNMNAEAFCVHNKTDRSMNVKQTLGRGKFLGGYDKTLKPGEDGCCHWSNKDCNKDGGKGDPVGFIISDDSVSYYTEICYVEIPACSDADITGSNGNYRCVTHGFETCN